MRPKLTAKLTAVLLAAPLAFPASALANHHQISTFEAPTELVNGSPQLRQSTLQELKRFGVPELRIVLYWRDVAPDPTAHQTPSFDQTNPAAYNWGGYDAAIDEAHAMGFKILLTVSGPVPTWATRHGSDEGGTHRPSRHKFREFMTAVGRHYANLVDDWSIWNEPNHPDFLTPQFRHHKPVSGRIYRKLFMSGYKGIMADSANRHDHILAGETAPVGTRHEVAPLQFMRGALCLNRHWHERKHCHKLPAYGWAHHAYTRKPGPYYHDPGKDNVVLGDLRRLNRALNKAGRAHAIRRHAGIYLSEFGIQSKPDPFYGVGYHKQADYRSISEYVAWTNGRVKSFSQYLMRDDQSIGGFQSGLRTSDGRIKKPIYESYPIPLVALRQSRHRVKLWGYLRPAADQHLGHERATVYYRDHHGHWKRLKRPRTNRSGYFTTHTRYHHGRVYKLRWTDHKTGVRYEGPKTRVYPMP